jgi:hypothetical protein
VRSTWFGRELQNAQRRPPNSHKNHSTRNRLKTELWCLDIIFSYLPRKEELQYFRIHHNRVSSRSYSSSLKLSYYYSFGRLIFPAVSKWADSGQQAQGNLWVRKSQADGFCDNWVISVTSGAHPRARWTPMWQFYRKHSLSMEFECWSSWSLKKSHRHRDPVTIGYISMWFAHMILIFPDTFIHLLPPVLNLLSDTGSAALYHKLLEVDLHVCSWPKGIGESFNHGIYI